MFFLFREQQLGASNSVDVRYGARRLKSVGRCSSRSPPRSSSPYWHWRLLDWLLRHLVRSSTAAAPASTGGGTGTSSALTRRHSTCDALGCMDAARDLASTTASRLPATRYSISFIPRCAPLLGDLVPDAAHTGSGDWCVLRGAAIATPPACCVCRVPCARGVLSGSSLPLTIALALASRRRRSHSASKRTAAHCRWGHEAERPIHLLNIGGPARVLQKRHRIFFLSPCGAITSTVDRSSFLPFIQRVDSMHTNTFCRSL